MIHRWQYCHVIRCETVRRKEKEAINLLSRQLGRCHAVLRFCTRAEQVNVDHHGEAAAASQVRAGWIRKENCTAA